MQNVEVEIKKFLIETNKILKNTYLLLSLTLIFSSITLSASILMKSQMGNSIFTLIIYMTLIISIHSKRDSYAALFLIFILTGFMGFSMGEIINYYFFRFSNGIEMIMTSIGMTGLILMIVSILSIKHQKNCSKLNQALGIGSIICLIAIILNLFLEINIINIGVSILISFLSCGIILWQTNQIVHGGERNYIIATISLYISMVNIFITVLQFLSIFIGRRN